MMLASMTAPPLPQFRHHMPSARRHSIRAGILSLPPGTLQPEGARRRFAYALYLSYIIFDLSFVRCT